MQKRWDCMPGGIGGGGSGGERAGGQCGIVQSCARLVGINCNIGQLVPINANKGARVVAGFGGAGIVRDSICNQQGGSIQRPGTGRTPDTDIDAPNQPGFFPQLPEGRLFRSFPAPDEPSRETPHPCVGRRATVDEQKAVPIVGNHRTGCRNRIFFHRCLATRATGGHTPFQAPFFNGVGTNVAKPVGCDWHGLRSPPRADTL